MVREVKVVPCDPSWKDQFRAEVEDLNRSLNAEVVRISHIGSSSIHGLSARPLIDVMVKVSDIENADELNSAMINGGYTPRVEFGVSGRRYFFKGTEDMHTHHEHVFGADHPEAMRHLAFRDNLSLHPESVRKFGELEEKPVKQFPDDIQTYMDGKEALIKKTEKFVIEWK